MTKPRNSLSVNVLLTELEMSAIIHSLTGSLSTIENEMILAWRVGKSKIQSASKKQYRASIDALVMRLRGIALSLYNDTEISSVSSDNKPDDIPNDYDKYLCVSDNIANLVSQDVLYQPDIDHSVAVFDRWIYICKIAFHQNDFFTASCIINGLTKLSIISSKIEELLTHSSGVLLRYYSLILEKSDSLYTKQIELIKLNFEVIPVLHSLKSLHAHIGEKTNKRGSLNLHQVEEIAVKKRAFSREFLFIQKKSKPELDVSDAKILTSLYRKFENNTALIKQDNGSVESLTNFENRSKTLRALVVDYKRKSVAEDEKKVVRFCVADYADLNDKRVELILIWASLAKLGMYYEYSPLLSIIDKVKSIIGKAEATDNAMRSQICDEFDLAEIKIDKKLRKIYKKINKLLIGIIQYDKKYGIKFKGEELKMSASSDETEAQPTIKQSPKQKLVERSESTSAYSATELDLSAAESESTSSKLSRRMVEVTAPLPLLQSPLMNVIASTVTSNATSEDVEDRSRPIAIERKIPSISSSIVVLSKLRHVVSPRLTDSARGDIEQLESARSVKLAKEAYEKSVVNGGGSLLEPIVVVSPRLQSARNGASLFSITPRQNNDFYSTHVGDALPKDKESTAPLKQHTLSTSSTS